jgi:UDP-N-acetylmuramoyl-tripeptide--D-alanyl-D-alanine ligase
MSNILISAQEILNISGFTLVKGNLSSVFNNVVIDSRKVKSGSLFIAVKGEKYDGHNFIKDVEAEGAEAVIISNDNLELAENFNGTVISYSDTIVALGKIANIWRNKLKAKVIGITGSNGKTTTKEFLSIILSEKYKVNKTEYNNNNHIGVPLTILSTDETVEILVLEHGTNHFGEIDYTAKISTPDIGIITIIGDSHLEYLIDRNGVLNEKYALFEETIKNNGHIFVNVDDELIYKKCRDINNKVTFGFTDSPDVKGEIIGLDNYGRTKLEVCYLNRKINLSLPVFGITSAKNVLSAVSIAYRLGLSDEEIISGVQKLGLVKGRLNISEINSTVIVDDTYNANPESMKAAIDLINSIDVKPIKIAVLGDMFELGELSIKKHIELAEYIKNSNVSFVYLLGNYTKYTSEKLSDLGIKNEHYEERELLEKKLSELNIDNSLFLFKGSRGMKMEQFIPIIAERVS